MRYTTCIKVFLLPCLMLLLFVPGLSADETAEGLVQRIYKEHQPGKDKSILDTRESLSKYFDEEMTSLFLKDAECSEKSGEICNLDWDPIYSGQDFTDSDIQLKITSKKENAGTATIAVEFVNFSPVKLTYLLHKTKDGWRVSDIVDEENHSLKEILSQPIE